MLTPYEWPAWMFVWWGVCFIAAGMAMVFWSHFWRSRPTPPPPALFQEMMKHDLLLRRMYKATRDWPGQIGHFVYFVFATAFTGTGVSFIVGGFLGRLTIPLVVACFIVAALLVILTMSLRTSKRRDTKDG